MDGQNIEIYAVSRTTTPQYVVQRLKSVMWSFAQTDFYDMSLVLIKRATSLYKERTLFAATLWQVDIDKYFYLFLQGKLGDSTHFTDIKLLVISALRRIPAEGIWVFFLGPGIRLGMLGAKLIF